MIEIFEGDKLIVGEKYCVRRKTKYLQIPMNPKIPKILIGIYKLTHLGCAEFKILNYNNPLYIVQDFYLFNIHLNDFYRYVSPEEYIRKRKEKYDQTCLNIVLKRLVNENFEW